MGNSKDEVTTAVTVASEKVYEAQTALEHAQAYAPQGSIISLILESWLGRLKIVHEELARPIASDAIESPQRKRVRASVYRVSKTLVVDGAIEGGTLHHADGSTTKIKR